MEPPPPTPPSATGAVAVTSAPHLHYPVPVNSNPLSPNTNSGDEKPSPPIAAAAGKLRLMCSYGGHIIPRPRDKSLCYVGGETRIVVADRRTTLSDLTHRLSKTLLHSRSFTLKYQLPNEDLDSLISVTTDDDLENMIDEYDRLTTTITTAAGGKSTRLRLFLFQEKPDSESSIGSLIENSTKSEDWFLDVLNGSSTGFSNSSSVNCLLGLDDDVKITGNLISEAKEFDSQLELIGNINRNFQDVQSVPNSPIMDARSSNGSASSSPSVANPPPIGAQVEDQKVGVGGFEEQLSQMSFGTALSSPATVVVASTASGEYSNQVFSNDERSEHGVPIGYKKSQAQLQTNTHTQPKPTVGLDLSSPDSVSSDGSVTNPLSRQRTIIYQDPIVRIPSRNNRIPNAIDPNDQKSSDPNSQVQLQQVQDSNYVFQTQFEQHQIQQIIQNGTHYIHHNPSGTVPTTSYYPIYPSQQHHHHPHHTLDPRYPIYYVPARQTQTSNLPVQQSNYSEPNSPTPYTCSQTPSQPATYNNPMRNAPPLVQAPSNQHRPQYLGFSQIHHSSQSNAPNSVVNPNYAYEFSDPSHAQIYYAQCQTMTAASGVGLSEASSQLSTANMKQQQIRTSQP